MWLFHTLVILATTTALAGPLDQTALNSKPFIIIAQSAQDFDSTEDFGILQQSNENIQIVTPASSVKALPPRRPKTTPKNLEITTNK